MDAKNKMLKEKLDAMAQQSAGNIPDAAKKIMAAATQLVSDSIAERNLPKIGDTLSHFELVDSKGQLQTSEALLAESNLILTFFRGGWWPYCVAELSALNEFVHMYRKSNARLLAISPQTPENNRIVIEKNKLGFEILFDKDNSYARSLDLVHGFEGDLIEIYRGFGIDVAKSNGNQVWELPMPTRLIVDQDKKIVSVNINAKYTERPEPEETLNVLIRHNETK